MILHADEFRPAVLLGDELHAGELGGPHAGGADVADFTGLHEVVEGAHGFVDGSGAVEAVDLEEVDVGGLEAGEGGFDLVEDGGAGLAVLVLVVFGLGEFGGVHPLRGFCDEG